MDFETLRAMGLYYYAPLFADHGDFLPASAVAKKMGVSTRTILKRIRAGELPAKKIGNKWLIPADGLANWLLKTNL